MSKEYRINGFRQIEAFYSIVFSGKHEISPQHISLYMFLLNQNNRSNWVEWFKCPYDLAMNGAMIGSKKTYYKCLTDLRDWGFIQYHAGQNQFKAPKISICRLENEPLLIPLCEPASEPLYIPAPAPLPTSARVRYINYITIKLNNLITGNIKTLENFDFDFEKFFNISINGEQNNGYGAGAESNLHETTFEKWTKELIETDFHFKEMLMNERIVLTPEKLVELLKDHENLLARYPKMQPQNINAFRKSAIKHIKENKDKKNGNSKTGEPDSELRRSTNEVLRSQGFKN